jgi:hypothetical protein
LPRSEIIERERRWAPYAAAAAFAVLALYIASVVVQTGVPEFDPESEAERLVAYSESSGTFLLSAILSALSFGLMAVPLAYLFRAAADRSDRMRRALIGVTIAGPLFLAGAALVNFFLLDSAASDFLAGDCAVDDNDCAEDLITESSLINFGIGLSIAGALGLAVGLVYTSLWSMRTGLLTRFVGTLGMAVGVASVLFNPIFALAFIAWLGLIFIGRVPGGRPPAWDAGEAVPWPAPGEQRAPGPDPDEPVEGRADEIFPDAAPSEDEPEPGSIADEIDRASRKDESDPDGPDDGPRKRKSR